MKCPMCYKPEFKVVMDISGDYVICSNSHCKLSEPTSIRHIIKMLRSLKEEYDESVSIDAYNAIEEERNNAFDEIERNEYCISNLRYDISELETTNSELRESIKELHNIIEDLNIQLLDTIRSINETD